MCTHYLIGTYRGTGTTLPTTEEFNLERNTQAKGDTPHLSEGVPNKITLIRLSQGSLDRWRREKVIWKMVTEHSCNPFADLESESRSKKVVVVEVAQEDSWDKEGGTKGLVRLAMSLIRA